MGYNLESAQWASVMSKNKPRARPAAAKKAKERAERKRLKRLEARRAATAASQAEGEGVEEC